MGRLGTLNCVFCALRGHELVTCPTRVALDSVASKGGWRPAWGRTKGRAYYDDMVAENPLLGKRR